MSTLVTSFLIGSSSFLQVTRTCLKVWMKFGQIPPLPTELATLERLKNQCIMWPVTVVSSVLIGSS